MAITLRSRREIELMSRAGVVVANVLSKLQEVAGPGITTSHLDSIALKMTNEAGAQALFKGVRSPYAKIPFPGAICTSINDEVVHGIPSGNATLRNGDILSVDFGVRLNGYCADAAITIAIGDISRERRRLMDVTQRVLETAIEKSAPAVKWSQVAAEMQQCAERAGFSVVRDFVGHGIGREMHEEPRVPNFASHELRKHDVVLTEGMVLAVEPMINAGSCAVRTLKNGWTVVTKDGKSSAHFEHTIAIVKGGCKILTVKGS